MSSELVLVTGCASGIGRTLVATLVASGRRVVATDVDAAALEESARADGWPADRVTRLALDVRDAARWEAVLDEVEARLGPLDVLVNNAGVLKPGRADALTPAEIDLHLDVNTKGVLLGTAAAARRMAARGRGHVVNVASLAALTPAPGLALYAASKWAVRGFTLSVAYELRARGVAVTCVCPDAVATPMLDLQVAWDEAALTFSGGHALTPAEVARAIAGPVLADRPLEVILPLSRGLTAKLAGALPSLGAKLQPWFVKRGRKKQDRLRK